MNRILIVDDSMFMRLSLKQILQRNGFEVVAEGENGAKGVELYKRFKPDLVTLDITMPEMDGLEALINIKKINPDAKAIMISALGQESFVKQAIMNGAKSFIVKPYKEEFVINVIRKIIGSGGM